MKKIHKIAAVMFVLVACFSSQSMSAAATNVKCSGCVGSSDIKNGSIKSSDIKNSNVTTGKIKDGAVTLNKLGPQVLDSLVTADGKDVAVDCDADSTALLNTNLIPGNTYILTGICDGPIAIVEPAGVYRFQGDDIGSKDDGISLPAGHIPDGTPSSGYAVIAYGPVAAKFVNLTISATLYTSSLDVFVNTLWAGANSSVILTDVDIVGGDRALFAENSDVVIREGVTVTGFRTAGLASFRGGSIIALDPITVTGLLLEPGDESYALLAVRSGTVEIFDGGTFSTGTDDGTNPDYENGVLGIWDNSSMKIANQGTSIFNGDIRVGRSSSAKILSGSVTGELWVNKNSVMQLRNFTHSSGAINITDGSVLAVRSGTTLSSGSSDTINVNRLSEIHFLDGAVGNLSGTATIGLNHYSLMQAKGDTATDFTFRHINCSNSIFIQTNVSQVGTVTGCQ